MGNLTRRGFLGGVAGAGAVTLAPSPAVAQTVAQTVDAATSPRFFGRIFPNLPPFAENTPRVQDALRAMGAPGGLLDAKDPLREGPIRLITNPELSPGNLDNPFNTAGTTFLGQFIDHDLTFDLHSRLAVPAVPEQSPNTRNPTLSLDSVYGGGPVQSPQLYDSNDRAKFRVESGGLFEDLPRRSDGVAIIGDPRNDENLIISGLHAAFLLFHNRVVDRLRAQNTPADRVFAEAQRTVVWHYQWIVVHEFLPQVIGFGLTQDILTHGRRFYRPAQNQHFMPVEFQGACYRFGHSQVRPSYRANLKGDSNNQPFFGFIFDPAAEGQSDPVDLRGGRRARRRFIGWQTFFDFGDGQVRPNKRIDTHISTPLFRLPLGAIADGSPPTALPQRNLLRHLTWSLPSGQAVAQAMGIPVLDNVPELREFGFDRSTPLWYYTLREAETLGDGITLAGASARLIGEVFVGLLQLDPESYLRQQPGWKPTLPARSSGQFGMVDLLRLAGVDPVSRGQ
ncbi:heme peroxidase family protein [Lentzea roselyniae]|uniref:Heme peroxidase family protein n=1 Tax=Lentzea roselyniae TaxID=531940 RepID=A0ABP7BWF6_9PSEU